jgi:hypothetical protein
MPDAQAAPAPAADAAQNATPAPVSAPGAEPPAGEKPADGKQPEKKRGPARHAEIRAKLAATKSETPAAGDKPTDATASPPPATKSEATAAEPEKPKPAVGAVMRLTAENTRLKSELDELRGKLDVATKGETVSALRERIKADPAVIFDVFGDAIDADGEKAWERLVDSVRDRNDPVAKAERETRSEVERLKAKLAEREAQDAERGKSEAVQRARAHTASWLTEGHTSEDGAVKIDPAKYPYVNHLTKVGEVDVHLGVAMAARKLVAEFESTNGRKPSDVEVARMVQISADAAEEHFAKRAKRWSLTPSAPPIAAPPAAKTPRPTTIGSGLGNRAPGGVDPKTLSKKERHQLISARLREANRAARANAPN